MPYIRHDEDGNILEEDLQEAKDIGYLEQGNNGSDNWYDDHGNVYWWDGTRK